MSSLDYKSILDAAFTSLGLALRARDDAEIEIAKQKQFIAATLQMLPDEERKRFAEMLRQVIEKHDSRSIGLGQAVRRALSATEPKFVTVAQVRDHLMKSGFDFSEYTANPLASISTTLRRMTPDEVETTVVGTVTCYRFKAHRPRLAEAVKNAKA
jgi:hypothetical protein